MKLPQGYFEDVLFPSWVDFFRVKDGFAFNAFGSCKSENRTILCPASMYGSTDMVYAYFAVGLLDELRKNQVKKLGHNHECRPWASILNPVSQSGTSKDTFQSFPHNTEPLVASLLLVAMPFAPSTVKLVPSNSLDSVDMSTEFH